MAYKILSIDGGGIRGIISSVWLAELEARVGLLWNHFDLIIGTSVGSILGCGVAAGKPSAGILDALIKDAANVFPSFWGRLGHTLTHPLGPKYSALGVEHVLHEQFGDLRMAELKTHTMAVAYDLCQGIPVFFSSVNDGELMVRDVCRSSSAAPVFFAPHIMDLHGEKTALIDGAVVLNNPAPMAIPIYLRERANRDESIIISVGAGSPGYLDAATVEQWNYLDWIANIAKVVGDGTTDAGHMLVDTNPKIKNYVRFQTTVRKSSQSIDDASKKNINSLVDEAKEWIYGEEGQFNLKEATHLLLGNTE